jgi:tetratricopeptide (TPR) repeat protein
MGEPFQITGLRRLEGDGLSRRLLPLVTLGGFGLLLFWLIISRSVVAYLATVAPEQALLLRSDAPEALISVADRKLNFTDKGRTGLKKSLGEAPDRLSALGKLVEAALVIDPLNPRSYRLLGQIAEAEQDVPKAKRFMQEAVKHSLNETYAVEWLMRKSFQERDFAAAAVYADVFLRSHPQLMEYALRPLGAMAQSKDANGELVRLLATNPPWRRRFFQMFGTVIADPRTPLAIFLALKDTIAPPTVADLRGYLSLLFEHKMYDLAYYTWLQFLPPEQLEGAGLLFNGDFAIEPSGLPFDWVIQAGSNVIIDIVPRRNTAGKNALFLEFGHGRADFPGVFQTTMLPPGAYQFNGSFKGEIVGPRGLQWSISCMGGTVIGESQMIQGSFPHWGKVELSFTVPDSGCRAQLVRLALAARSASEQIISGSISFDQLSISRRVEGPVN